MADIPFGNYNVNLKNSNNNWANGELKYTSATDVKYKGIDVTSSFNPVTTSVGWDVTLSHGGPDNCPLVFFAGQYSVNSVSQKGQITGGTVSGSCIEKSAEDMDNWSANATSVEEEQYRHHEAHGH
jgi:hypothetical protein